MEKKLGNVITAMVTPFTKEYELDEEQAINLVDRLIKEGTDTVLLAGTTGESPTMTTEEKLRLFKIVVGKFKGTIPIMAGTGGNNTKASIELSKKAEAIGVDTLLLVVPYYNKPTQNDLYIHFKAIAESVSIPVVLYNVPSRTVTNLEPATVAKLAKIDNIIGIKEACGNMDQISALKMQVPSDFLVYSGDDSLTLPMLSLGCTGVISVASQVIGTQIREMIQFFNQGKVKEAAELHYKMMPVFKSLFVSTNPGPIKAAVTMSGLDVGPLRLPLNEVSDDIKELVFDSLKDFRSLNRYWT